MRIKLVVLFLALAFSTAHAQEVKSPEVRALMQRVGQEVNSNLQCVTANNTLQDKITALEAEVKKLSEPKPVETK